MCKYDYKKSQYFSQNVWKNNLLTNAILEAQIDFNIIFIQEPPWSIIRFISSSSNKEGEELVGIPNHSNWIIFSRNPTNSQDLPRVITYINTRISFLHFSLYKDIFNHRDISFIQLWLYLFSDEHLLRLFSNGFKVSQGY